MEENSEKRNLPPGWNKSAANAPAWAARRKTAEPEPIAEPEQQPEPETLTEPEQPAEPVPESAHLAEPQKTPEDGGRKEKKAPKTKAAKPAKEKKEKKAAEAAGERSSGGKKGLVIALVVLLVLAAAGAGVYFMKDGFDKGGHVTQKITELEAGTAYSAEELFAAEEGFTIKEAGLTYEFYSGEAAGSGEVKMYAPEELSRTIPVTAVKESGKEYTEEFIFTVKDTTSPEIGIGERYDIQLGTALDLDAELSFTDAGIKGLAEPLTREEFEKCLGGKVEVDDSALDAGSEGEYTVTVRAEDASGNRAEKSFTVKVTDSGTAFALNSDTQYEANIFLSNFAEQGIVSLERETSPASAYADFVLSYMMRNESNSLSVVQMPGGAEGFDVTLLSMSLDQFESKMTRFFGFEIGRDALNELPAARFNGSDWPSGPFFDGSYLYQYAASGWGIPPVAVVDSVLDFADGHQEMQFSVYNCNWAGSELYRFTPEQAASDSRLTLAGHGTAVVRPKDWYGRNTYELVSYQYWW